MFVLHTYNDNTTFLAMYHASTMAFLKVPFKNHKLQYKVKWQLTNLFFIIIDYLIILTQRVSSIFFKLSQLINFYSDKKPIYEILCVIKQLADSTRVKQAKFHKS